MTLAREGWEIIAGVAAAALVLTFFFGSGAWWAWVAVAFVVQFFREPQRAVADPSPLAVLAPADGRVVFVGQCASPLAGDGDGDASSTADEMLKISIFMNVFNVHANYAPTAGTVTASRPFAGKFFNADLDKASLQNERHQIVIDAAIGTVVCTQIAGFVARRILCYAQVGDTLQAGQRYGFIRFGSRVDVYLPHTCQANVMLGDKVKAKLTTLARALEPQADLPSSSPPPPSTDG